MNQSYSFTTVGNIIFQCTLRVCTRYLICSYIKDYYFYLLKDLSASSDLLLMNIAVQNKLSFTTWKLPPEQIYQVLGLNVTSKTWLHDAQT